MAASRVLFSFQLIFVLSLADLLAVSDNNPSLPEPLPQQGNLQQKNDAMSDLLFWAVQHSDPDKLKEMMTKYKENNLTLKDVYSQEVIDALFIDEAKVIMRQVAIIQDFRNVSLPEDELQAALQGLEDYLHQIDNAGNLHKMGGLLPLLDLALSNQRNAETRSLAMWALGVAVQNNPPVQKDLRSLNGLDRLVKQLAHCNVSLEAEHLQLCAKLLFAISGLVKNDNALQVEADKLGLLDWLFDVGSSHLSLTIAKKAMAILDTVLGQNSEVTILDRLSGRREAIAEALLFHVSATESDTDAAEKALHLINRLLSLRPTLFHSDAKFQKELQSASRVCQQYCELKFGVGDDICKDLLDLSQQADRLLSAGQTFDYEL